MSELRLPPIQPYFPTTFLERGVAVPFTTPLLFGSRARPALRGHVELILPNPTGGRGVYVLAWESVREFCRPTVHDRQLILRITALPAITPIAIRRLAHEVAAEGMAGEEAMEAARAKMDASRDDLVAANYMLLMALIAQVDANTNPGVLETAAPDLEQRAHNAVARIAPRIGKPTAWVATSLEALAEVLHHIGVNPKATGARVRRLLVVLNEVRTDIAAWSHGNADDGLACYADMVCEVADVTLSLAKVMFDAVHALTADPIGLLRSWAIDPDLVTRLAGRPEWLLDGWGQICLLWREATHAATRRSALAEIAQLVPVLPREATDWAGIMLDSERLTRLRRVVPLNEDWRTGAIVYELLARNEHLRALGV